MVIEVNFLGNGIEFLINSVHIGSRLFDVSNLLDYLHWILNIYAMVQN